LRTYTSPPGDGRSRRTPFHDMLDEAARRKRRRLAAEREKRLTEAAY